MMCRRMCNESASCHQARPKSKPLTRRFSMTTTNEEFSLIRTICTNPHCDIDRLVYADWLDEHEQPERAEFIRLQCLFAELQQHCSCGSCVKTRGGGQHTNGPCAIDRERVVVPGKSGRVSLRLRLLELWDYHPWSDGLMTHFINNTLGVASILGTHDRGDDLSGYPIAVVSRGFASEIRCTLERFMDRECPTCAGSGFLPFYAGHGNIGERDCDACDWAGTIPGLARALFATHPITRVVLTDRRPEPDEGYQCHSWANADAATSLAIDFAVGSGLPGSVFAFLPKPHSAEILGSADWPDGFWAAGYPTHAHAMSALSLACVNYARNRHVMPLLLTEGVQ